MALIDPDATEVDDINMHWNTSGINYWIICSTHIHLTKTPIQTLETILTILIVQNELSFTKLFRDD